MPQRTFAAISCRSQQEMDATSANEKSGQMVAAYKQLLIIRMIQNHTLKHNKSCFCKCDQDVTITQAAFVGLPMSLPDALLVEM